MGHLDVQHIPVVARQGESADVQSRASLGLVHALDRSQRGRLVGGDGPAEQITDPNLQRGEDRCHREGHGDCLAVV